MMNVYRKTAIIRCVADGRKREKPDLQDDRVTLLQLYPIYRYWYNKFSVFTSESRSDFYLEKFTSGGCLLINTE